MSTTYATIQPEYKVFLMYRANGLRNCSKITCTFRENMIQFLHFFLDISWGCVILECV